jgi:hypothetical protein
VTCNCDYLASSRRRLPDGDFRTLLLTIWFHDSPILSPLVRSLSRPMLLMHHRTPVSTFLLRSHQPFNLCRDLCPDSMHAYIFVRWSRPPPSVYLASSLRRLPTGGFWCRSSIDSLCVFSVVTTTGFRQAPWCTPGVSTNRWSATTCRDPSDRTGSHPCIMYILMR